MVFGNDSQWCAPLHGPVVPHEELRERFGARERAGLKVDDRLWNRLGTNTTFEELQLTQSEFMQLIWQSLSGKTHIIAPPGSPRTLKDVAVRACDLGIVRLAEMPAIDPTTHNPSWFERCVAIDAAFDFLKFWELVIVDANKFETSDTPQGRYYLHDGNHKALVLACQLLQNKLTYQPVTALFMSPREEPKG